MVEDAVDNGQGEIGQPAFQLGDGGLPVGEAQFKEQEENQAAPVQVWFDIF
jgi:hypothetical protein